MFRGHGAIICPSEEVVDILDRVLGGRCCATSF
jgi:hypothetical protein